MSGLPFMARALFDYDAVEPTELNLTTGDTVSIEEVNESGWSLARLVSSMLGQPTTDRIGWIPTEYIEKIGVVGGGDMMAIAVERPQPLSASQPIQMSETTALSSAATAAAAADDDVEEEVGALTITTAPPPVQATTSATATHFSPPAINAITAPPTPTAILPTPTTPTNHTSNAATTANNLLSAAAATPPAAPTAATTTKVCAFCHENIKSAFVMARDQLFHPNHFLCHTCRTPLGGKPYLEHNSHFYCEADYYEQFNPKCHTCHTLIKGAYIAALDHCYHPHCFTCTHCHAPFTDNHYRQHDGLPYCEQHFAALFAPPCHTCNLPITSAIFEALDRKYHLDCFVCAEGGHAIGENVLFHLHEGRVYCPEHFELKFLQLCGKCGKGIRGQYVKVGDEMFHSECWQCGECNCVLRVDNCGQVENKFYCKACVVEKKRQASPLAQLASNPSSNRSSRAPSAVSSPLPPRQNNLTPARVLSPILAPTPPTTHSADVLPLSNPHQAASAADSSVTSRPGSPSVDYVEPGSGLVVEYSALKGTEARVKGVDPRRKECYLGEAEFGSVFGMGKSEFEKMPAWKRNEHKKRVGLF